MRGDWIMNHYPHHIGDYLKGTAHLTMLEDGAYRRLIDLYYLREGPLPADKRQVYRLARATSTAEKKAIDTVLEEFFVVAPDGFFHNRCNEEIEKYQLVGEDAEAKKENEKERQRRHRQRRKELFEALRSYDVVPPWDAKTTDLEALLSQHQERPVTRDSNVPATRTATANHYPIPNTHNLSPTPHRDRCTETDPGETNASDENPPYGDPTKAGLLAKLLRGLGVQVAPSNPSFKQWVDEGLDSEEAIAGVDIARGAKPAPEPIPWSYLSKVLTTQRKAGVAAVPVDGDDYGGLA